MAALVKTIIASAVLEGKKTLVHKACEEGAMETLRLLTDVKVDLEMKDDEGQTPLMVACQHMKSECFLLLLECGANPNVKDISGNTPLHVACAQLNLSYVRLLLEHGADPNVLDESENTPLHVVFQHPIEPEFVRLLLEHGADPNVLNKNDRPPMYQMWSNFHPSRGATDSVRLLLEHGVDIDRKCGIRGTTVLETACRKKSPSLVRLLLNYEAPGVHEALALVMERLQRTSLSDKRTVVPLEECKQLLTEHLASMAKKRPRAEEIEDVEVEEPSAKRARSSDVKV